MENKKQWYSCQLYPETFEMLKAAETKEQEMELASKSIETELKAIKEVLDKKYKATLLDKESLEQNVLMFQAYCKQHIIAYKEALAQQELATLEYWEKQDKRLAEFRNLQKTISNSFDVEKNEIQSLCEKMRQLEQMANQTSSYHLKNVADLVCQLSQINPVVLDKMSLLLNGLTSKK